MFQASLWANSGPKTRSARGGYKLRWRIESFFAWWKRHLHVYHLIAKSPYGLMVQILAGLITYYNFATLKTRSTIKWAKGGVKTLPCGNKPTVSGLYNIRRVIHKIGSSGLETDRVHEDLPNEA